MNAHTDDYDSPWKDALTRYLPEFMAFYFPQASTEINWNKPHTFLDQELAQTVQDGELGQRRVDRLVEVATLTSGRKWVYIHVEVQGQPDPHFAERLFTYNYRLYDRYQRPIATLAVLTDERKNWRPGEFSYNLFGCEVKIRFPCVKLLDYAPQLEELLQNTNPFALITAAHLLTQRTRKNPEARYGAKWQLARLLYERDWDKQRIIDLFAVIDWLMRLPPELENQLWTQISTLERNSKMRYVTSVERIGLQKGLEQGRQEGEVALLRRLLVKRFGALSESLESRLSDAAIADLELWGERVLDAKTITEVFQ
ncbi:MAG: Rpn family recombination-promoting nuclease/putative transposase [Microcystaceae cyanobacterium]